MEVNFPMVMMVVGFLLVPAGYGAPSADLISSLPGQPNVSFAQYSGYITINPVTSLRFFYYFVKATEDPASKPLTLWLNGGPGCSSIGNGAFREHGPFRPCVESGKLVANPFSWNIASNMLYLDSPAGVGWSYSNSTSDLFCTDESTAYENFIFLRKWLDAFPEYKGRKFYITGESYAGHYVPELASLLVDYMAVAGTSEINLVAMAIGNPLLYGVVDNPAWVFYLWTHAMISDSTYKSVKDCNFSITATNTKPCSEALDELNREVTDFIDPYDIILDVCLHSKARRARAQIPSQMISPYTVNVDVCIGDEVRAYMNLPEVQHAFHANQTKLPYRWNICNEGSLKYDRESVDDLSMLPYLSHVLKGGASILVYSGDQDSVIPFSSTRKLVDELAQMIGLNTTVQYSAWFDRGQVGGWTQVYGPLSYATVRGASHLVPLTSPERAMTLFKSFLSGHPLPLSAAEADQLYTV